MEQSERRAALRCPQYDTENIFWKKVNNLLKKEEEAVLQRIEDFSVAKKPSKNAIPHFLDTLVTGNLSDKKISDIDSFISSSSPTIIDGIPIYIFLTQEATAMTSTDNNVTRRNLESSDTEESSKNKEEKEGRVKVFFYNFKKTKE